MSKRFTRSRMGLAALILLSTVIVSPYAVAAIANGDFACQQLEVTDGATPNAPCDVATARLPGASAVHRATHAKTDNRKTSNSTYISSILSDPAYQSYYRYSFGE
jgi:hypothetical protein